MGIDRTEFINRGMHMRSKSPNSGGNKFSIDIDMTEIDAMISSLEKRVNRAVRPAAQAAAQVIYNWVLEHVPVSAHAHWFHGTHQKYFFEAGTLRRSIYQVYSKDNSADGVKATYHISWNHKKAPYGFMVEYGTARAPAHPFIRPAVASFDRALDAAMTKLLDIALEESPDA